METAAVRHYPLVTKNIGIKPGYFDQNNTVRIPNVTHFVHMAYIIVNKVTEITTSR